MLGGCSVGGVSAVGTTSGGVADTSQAHRVRHNKARSGIQGRRGTMIFCTEDSVWRTMISKEHPKDHCSSIGSPETKLQSLKLSNFVSRRIKLGYVVSPLCL